MGFWNRSSEEKPSEPVASDFTSPDESADFSSGPDMSGSLAAGGAGSANMALNAIRQQVLVQQVISELCEQAFEKCLSSGKPSESLRASDIACIHATVGKWMDTNDFISGRLLKKQQNAQQQKGFS